MTPVAAIYIVLISPIIHRLYACYVYNDGCNDSIQYHIQQMMWFASSGLFFAESFPQSLAPGRCDHFGHSHQLFHISIMLCTLRQVFKLKFFLNFVILHIYILIYKMILRKLLIYKIISLNLCNFA